MRRPAAGPPVRVCEREPARPTQPAHHVVPNTPSQSHARGRTFQPSAPPLPSPTLLASAPSPTVVGKPDAHADAHADTHADVNGTDTR